MLVGHTHGSINSRLSAGPSAHILSIKNLTQPNYPTAVPTTAVLDFSLETPLALTAEAACMTPLLKLMLDEQSLLPVYSTIRISKIL